MHNEIYLPVLHHFENGTVFTGSCGNLRYKITPNIVQLNPKEVDLDASSMRAEYWYGQLAYEFSDVEGVQVFPMSPEGREAMALWLSQQL